MLSISVWTRAFHGVHISNALVGKVMEQKQSCYRWVCLKIQKNGALKTFPAGPLLPHQFCKEARDVTILSKRAWSNGFKKL